MTDHGASESVVESAALARPESYAWTVKHGVEIAPGEPYTEPVPGRRV